MDWNGLSIVDARIIREASKAGFRGHKIAEYYKVHKATIYEVINNISFKNI